MLSPAQEILSDVDAKLITRFPFQQFSGGVVVLKACFENIPDSLNFILDSGCGGISLDSSTCLEFNIQTTASDTTITGIAGVRKVDFAFNRSLKLPGLTVQNLNFHINDYSVLTGVYGEKIDGVIGYSFLQRYIVKLNFNLMEMEVYSPGKIKYPPGGHLLHPIFTSLPIQYMQVRDRRKVDFNYYFDTGAGLCFLMSEQFAKDSNILGSKHRPVITQAEGMGGKLQMRLTVVKEVKLGPYRFRQVPTYLYTDAFGVTSYPFTGGLVGNDLLRRFNQTINYPQREIHLLPNNHFNDPFDYGYSGITIYYADGKVLVEDIIANSPADKAGFKLEDELVAVDNNFSNSIQQYKNMLQEPDKRMRVFIRRNGQLMELTLITTSIL
jgi:hypothetical protein